jgi:hypothetical protein
VTAGAIATGVVVLLMLVIVGYLFVESVRRHRDAREARAILTERARDSSDLSRHLRADPEGARAGAESVSTDPSSVPERRPRKHGPDGRFLPHD